VRRRNQGAVLLLVLAIVALLSALAVEIASRASADHLRATRGGQDATFRRLFDSGAEVARGLLAETSPPSVTHWGQPWNRPLAFTLGKGESAELRLADESAKINIARAISVPEEAPAIRDSVRRLFEYLARHEPKNGRDWMALGEQVLRRLSTRIPLLTLDGLRELDIEIPLVFGVEGLSRYLTCFGDGKINLNTAPRAVLASLDPEFDEAMVERIAAYRGGREGEAGPVKVFVEPQDLMLVDGIVNRSVGEDGTLRVDRNLYEKVKGLVVVRSACFSARIEAASGARRRQAWGFWKPDGSRLGFEEVLR